jgi:prolyl-tRNA synthetase
MKMSQSFGATMRAAPGHTDAEGHQLLLRAGMVRQLAQGIYSFLPLGWRSLRKIEAILRSEMDAVGGQELSMPVVNPADVWKASGRYFSVGPELARFSDRRGRDMVLAMTHEEVVVELGKSEISSYRDLPRLVYQIQTKFRDDPRPRAGLIRVREFLMKDAYSFDVDDDGLATQYIAQYRAYFNVFRRCGLPVIAVASDVGMMGGKLAHEFMYATPIGEDTLLLCDSCGYSANRQVATFRKPKAKREKAMAVEAFSTPGATAIDDLVMSYDIPAEKTAKAMFLAVDRERSDGSTTVEYVVALVRGDTELNETKLANAVNASDLRPMRSDEITKVSAVAGYGSAVGVTGATVVIDELVAASKNLVAGANREGLHLRNVNAGRDFTAHVVADITAARDGDPCTVCGHALRTTRGVEVGQIFKLGDRYSAAVGATFLDPDGQRRPVIMGCYGIGVGRLLACAAEEHRDEYGLRLPITIAPYQVHLCQLGPAGSPSAGVAGRLYDELWAAGVEVLHDDRGERPGVQFNDADLIGLPLRLVVGERSLERGGVEVRSRATGEATAVAVDGVVDHVRRRVAGLFDEVAATVVPVDLPDELRQDAGARQDRDNVAHVAPSGVP